VISAFGVEHGDISKALKPQHIAALQRAKAKTGVNFKDFRNSLYADDRLTNHGLQEHGGDIARRMDITRSYNHKGMARLTRTKRSLRDKNRKASGVFSAPAAIPKPRSGS